MATTRTARAWLLRLYPGPWRERYGDEFTALLDDSRITPLVVLDVLLGAIDARLHADLRPGRMFSMATRLRTCAVTIFAAFALFVFAYLSYQRLTDPRPPFDAAAQAHPGVRIAFAVLQDSAMLAVVAVLVGGLPILLAAARSALASRRRGVLLLFALPALGVALTLATLPIVSAVFAGVTPTTKTLTPLQIGVELGWLALVGLTFVGGVIALVVAIKRSEIGAGVLRFAILPATVVVLAMAASLVGVVLWAIFLWIDDPRIYGGVLGDCAATACYGNTGDIGIGGVAFVVVCMALAVVIGGITLGRAYRIRASMAG